MYDWLGPTMFLGALVILGIGYPVAFSLGCNSDCIRNHRCLAWYF